MHLVSTLGLLLCAVALKSSDMTVSSGILPTTEGPVVTVKKDATGTPELRNEATTAARTTPPRGGVTGAVPLGEQTKPAEATTGTGNQRQVTGAEATTTRNPSVVLTERTRNPPVPLKDETQTTQRGGGGGGTVQPGGGGQTGTAERRDVTETRGRSDELTTRKGPENLQDETTRAPGQPITDTPPERTGTLISCPDEAVERLDNGTCFSGNATVINDNVGCPFFNYDGCNHFVPPFNHCSGCFQEKELCADGVGRRCNESCIERGHTQGRCDTVQERRCPCLLSGYRACYCDKRRVD